MNMYKNVLLFFALCSALCLTAAPRIQLGITKYEAAKHSIDFEIYGKEAAYYRDKGINAALIDYNYFYKPNTPNGILAKDLKRHHVVFLRVFNESIHKVTPAQLAYGRKVGKILLDYVKAGGGLIIQPSAVRYVGDDDEKYWNEVFGVLGFKLEREGVADLKTLKMIEDRAGSSQNFFHTSNIIKHPVTKGIDGLWLPVWNAHANKAPGSCLMTYSPGWEVVIRGNKTAQTFINNNKNHIDLNQPGSVKSAPPICAVRTIGKGRVAVLAASFMHTGLNVGIEAWYQIAESVGADNKPGNTMKLMTNLARWCAEPSMKLAGFGTYKPKKYEKVKFPVSVNWDRIKFKQPAGKLYKGIVGAHTSYSDGRNTVAEYVAAAKKNGLSFIVFTEPLEKLTEKKLEQLKKDCIANSGKDFIACPGVEFTDGSGIRWIFYGPKVVWPDEKPFYKDGFKHTLWDGKVIKHFGRYSNLCNFSANGIIDFKDLRKNKIPRENLWWIFRIITHAWDHDKLIADNMKDYRFQLRDLRRLSPITFTRITAADQVPAAMDRAVTAVKSMNSLKALLSSRCSVYFQGLDAGSHVSIGQKGAMELKLFQAINCQQDPRVLRTRGTQRVPTRFIVTSPNGIKEVRIYDSDRELLRTFIGKGQKVLTKDFELVHDKQRYLLLEATDTKGNKLISHPIILYDYKQGFFRCGDNLNILGPLGLIMHPDRSERFPQTKPLRTAGLYSYSGEDSGSALCPFPRARSLHRFYLDKIGEAFPGQRLKNENLRMDVQLAGGDLQVVDTIIDSICEKYDNHLRPGPATCSPARILGKHPYFVHNQRAYSARDRVDFHVMWDNRRKYEAMENYDSGFQYFEGEVTFTKDVTFHKHMNLSVVLGEINIHPPKIVRTLSDKIIWIDPVKGLQTVTYQPGKKQNMKKVLAENGFVTLINSKIGYIGVIPCGSDGKFAFDYNRNGRLAYGLNLCGRTFRKGESFRYSYIVGTYSDNVRDHKKIALSAAILRDKKYPYTIKQGTLNKNGFFFDVTAKDNRAEFTLHQKGLGIDLPIRVRGLEDNGCVAVYSTLRPRFRFVGFDTKDKFVYFQESIDSKNHIRVGNIFLASNKALKLTLVTDGQNPGKKPFLEIHNPTGKAVTARIWSPKGTPEFGGRAFTVTVPAKGSVFRYTDGKQKK